MKPLNPLGRASFLPSFRSTARAWSKPRGAEWSARFPPTHPHAAEIEPLVPVQGMRQFGVAT